MGSSKMMRGALRSSRVVRLDWVALGNKVTSDAGKLELANLRAAYSEIVKTTSSAPATTPQVDWAKWKATIKTPGVVDDFQAAFGKLSVPAMEDTFTAKVEADFAAALSTAEGLASTSESRIKELAANPEIAAEIEAEIEANKW